MLDVERWLQGRRRLVVGLWVLALVAAVPFAARQTEPLTGGVYDAPRSQSEAVETALATGDFPRGARASMAVLLIPAREATPKQVRGAVDRVAAIAHEVDDVALSASARDRARQRATRQPAGRPLVVPLTTAVGQDAAIDLGRDLRRELGATDEAARIGPVVAHVVGQGAMWAAVQDAQKDDVRRAEVIGFPIVALILVAVFGSITAAALPLALGFVAVGLTGAVIYWLGHAMGMSVFTTNMASMIGIGVAVDYSLFVLARYREEIARGRGPDQARSIALATSGLAVLFSGLTVIASLLGLFLLEDQSLRSMATGAIVVVAIAVLAACTLLPLLLALLGERVYAPRRIGRRRVQRRGPRPEGEGFWDRWTAGVMRRPALSAGLATAVLLVMAIPALDLVVANRATSLLPEVHEARDGLAALGEARGPSGGNPLKVVVGTGDETALRRVGATLEREPIVGAVRSPIMSRDGERALVIASLRVPVDADAAGEGVVRLRDRLPAAAPDARIDVGGTAAEQHDYDTFMLGSLWKVLLFVLGVSFVVLVVLLRSLALPLKAVAMNLLAVAAAYGALVATFQWGWLEWAGIERSGHLQTFTPPLILAVVFGLSMDYEVFLLSRIRERWFATRDTQRAVASGLASSAGTITSAALIMIAVFLTFLFTGVPAVRQLGLGTAVAIAVDATLVRLVLVPAAMSLVGKWNWWLPRPLARVLPETSVEDLDERAATPAHVAV